MSQALLVLRNEPSHVRVVAAGPFGKLGVGVADSIAFGTPRRQLFQLAGQFVRYSLALAPHGAYRRAAGEI